MKTPPPSHKFHHFAIALVLLFIAADSHHWYVRYPLAALAAHYMMSALVMLLQEVVRCIASPVMMIEQKPVGFPLFKNENP